MAKAKKSNKKPTAKLHDHCILIDDFTSDLTRLMVRYNKDGLHLASIIGAIERVKINVIIESK